MSFSVYLNSTNGTQVVGGQNNQIQYNFDFANTPKHDGPYKVYMSFSSEQQTYASGSASFGVVRIQDLGGILDSYSPLSSFTAARQNHVFGLIRPSVPHMGLTTSLPATTSTGTASIPANSGTTAYTLTTTTTTASGLLMTNLNAVQTIDAKMNENPPVYLQSKPRNNQFTIRLTNHDGVLYPSLGATHYSMILTFEAV